jgi:hypothetical protein
MDHSGGDRKALVENKNIAGRVMCDRSSFIMMNLLDIKHRRCATLDPTALKRLLC